MFARELIKAGEVVIVWGGVVLTRDDIQAGRYRRGTLSAIADEMWLGGAPDDEDYEADYTNHSCDPNLWMEDEATLAARRDIEAGEEITADYMMWEADEGYRAAWRCNCSSQLCRGCARGTGGTSHPFSMSASQGRTPHAARKEQGCSRKLR